jgi:hypothetical protein
MISSWQIDRYRARIRQSVSVDENGCWIWQKSTQKNGYGVFAFGGGNNARAHRVSYMAFVGVIPLGMDVCHRCDVRNCVNPEHLFTGTRAENIADCLSKGRHPQTNKVRGSNHPHAKLTESDVEQILCMLASGCPKAAIARQFSVTDRVILLIAKGDTWKHVRRAA